MWCCWFKNITDVDYLPHCVTILISVTIKSEFIIPWFMSYLVMCQIGVINTSHSVTVLTQKMTDFIYLFILNQFALKCNGMRDVQ